MKKYILFLISLLFIVFSLNFYFLKKFYLIEQGKKEIEHNNNTKTEKEQKQEKKVNNINLYREKEKLDKTIFLIIDDAGWYNQNLNELLNLNIELTIAIIPGSPKAKKIYNELIKKEKISIFIHQPMEAKNYKNNEKELLRINMSEEEILNILNNNLLLFPLAIGMNNHTGSLFTENYEKMKIVLKWCKENNIIFVDSKTSEYSIIKKICNEIKFPYFENEFFIDNIQDTEYITHRLNLLKEKTLKRKFIIAIGHIHSNIFINQLKNEVSDFLARGIKFKKFSKDILFEMSEISL
ncbi:MAG TPA: divergent polysaccharide deacetylase family protein [bacterium]|nr:divergent polysaccharide deacetylase family protein [bacterium]HOL46841.1 divergent polysaccharide deacetylase family protein [bacterium]HPQ18810.1 divergent polysaccharide deacetylase family protein [bacterium]